MFKYILDFLIRPLQDHMDYAADHTISTVKSIMDSTTGQISYICTVVLPATIYSTLFFAAGVIIAILGASQLVDTATGTRGSGMLAGGIILVILGFYYKNKILPEKQPGKT